MKPRMLLIICLIAGTAVSAELRDPSPLAKDLQDFVDLIPQDKITQIAVRYYIFDSEVKEVVAYLKDKEFTSVWNQVFAYEDTKRLIAYLEANDVPAKKHINEVGLFFGLPDVQRGLRFNKASEVKGKGFKNMVDEILLLIPQQKIGDLFNEKMDNSAAFQDLYKKISGADFEKIDSFIRVS